MSQSLEDTIRAIVRDELDAASAMRAKEREDVEEVHKREKAAEKECSEWIKLHDSVQGLLRAAENERDEAFKIATDAAPDLEGQPDRDTLVRRVAALATRYEHARGNLDILRAKLAAAERERDERAKWRKHYSEESTLYLKQMLLIAEALGVPKQWNGAHPLLEAITALRAKLDAAERERDEARKFGEDHMHRATRFETERDEAKHAHYMSSSAHAISAETNESLHRMIDEAATAFGVSKGADEPVQNINALLGLAALRTAPPASAQGLDVEAAAKEIHAEVHRLGPMEFASIDGGTYLRAEVFAAILRKRLRPCAAASVWVTDIEKAAEQMASQFTDDFTSEPSAKARYLAILRDCSRAADDEAVAKALHEGFLGAQASWNTRPWEEQRQETRENYLASARACLAHLGMGARAEAGSEVEGDEKNTKNGERNASDVSGDRGDGLQVGQVREVRQEAAAEQAVLADAQPVQQEREGVAEDGPGDQRGGRCGNAEVGSGSTDLRRVRVMGAKSKPPRCPNCGYTAEDCAIHMDHYLCGEPTPPSLAPSLSPATAKGEDTRHDQHLVEHEEREAARGACAHEYPFVATGIQRCRKCGQESPAPVYPVSPVESERGFSDETLREFLVDVCQLCDGYKLKSAVLWSEWDKSVRARAGALLKLVCDRLEPVEREPGALRACPFCGARPVSGHAGDDDGGYFHVDCPDCRGGDGQPFAGVHGDSIEACRAAWNRRASDAEVERLRGLLAEARREHESAPNHECDAIWSGKTEDDCTCGAREWNARIDAALAHGGGQT